MTTLIFDLETNGLLEELNTVHSLVIKDHDTNEVFSYGPNSKLFSGIYENTAIFDKMLKAVQQ